MDLGRWLIEAQRGGVDVDLRPLELAASCGSEAAAFTLGSHRVPDHVACFRSLCRALRACKGHVGKRARGDLGATLVAGLVPSDEAQAARRDQVMVELARWSIDLRLGLKSRIRCWEVLRTAEESEDRDWRRVERTLKRATDVMATSNRGSARL